MSTDTTTQETRRKHLQALADDYHRSRYGDYDDSYSEFAAEYGLTWEEDVDIEDVIEDVEQKQIPRYASLANDETYGMISVHDTLTKALRSQANVPHNGETLNHPCGIVDLDTGLAIETRTVVMSTEAYHTLCGLVQDDENVNSAGIFSEAWPELRETFPLATFREKVPEIEPGNDPDTTPYYIAAAGE